MNKVTISSLALHESLIRDIVASYTRPIEGGTEIQWNRAWAEHPEWLDQLGMPRQDDPSFDTARNTLSKFVSTKITKTLKPLLRKTTRIISNRAPKSLILEAAQILPRYTEGRHVDWAKLILDHPQLASQLKLATWEGRDYTKKAVYYQSRYKDKAAALHEKRQAAKRKNKPTNFIELQKASPVRAQLHALGGDNIQVNPVTVAPFCPHCGAHKNHWGNQ